MGEEGYQLASRMVGMEGIEPTRDIQATGFTVRAACLNGLHPHDLKVRSQGTPPSRIINLPSASDNEDYSSIPSCQHFFSGCQD